ncbi:polysaccharide deacetylase family protein [Alphaproteobacteria bacterium LSUCC0719]
MFHHFHDRKHLETQGSLSQADFLKMIEWLAKEYNLIGASKYLEKYENDCLADQDICLSFDDALLSQYDIAVPVLQNFGLDAFFFVYSSPFTGSPCYLETFRYFRTNCFVDLDEFYSQFFTLVQNSFDIDLGQVQLALLSSNYLAEFPFYTENDKCFRFIRDQMLGREKYECVMLQLMSIKGFSSSQIINDLWMSEDHLRDIANYGHLVGLHSYSHPTQMSKLTYKEQLFQYQANFDHLTTVVGDVVCMSHPCGDYNADTVKILDDLGIKIGFRSSLSKTHTNSRFEIPRQDHVNIHKAVFQ